MRRIYMKIEGVFIVCVSHFRPTLPVSLSGNVSYISAESLRPFRRNRRGVRTSRKRSAVQARHPRRRHLARGKETSAGMSRPTCREIVPVRPSRREDRKDRALAPSSNFLERTNADDNRGLRTTRGKAVTSQFVRFAGLKRTRKRDEHLPKSPKE